MRGTSKAMEKHVAMRERQAAAKEKAPPKGSFTAKAPRSPKKGKG